MIVLTWIKTLAVWYPVAFGDESTYSLLAKYGSTGDVVRRIGLVDQIPNHLYFGLYSLVYFFGDNFLVGAKLFNSIFIAGAFFPIYLLCRLFLSYGQSVALAAICVLGPISSYATYFMPESMYFFGFWMYVYLSIRQVDKPVIAQGCIGGALLGLQVLIKPHALLLLPCTAVLCAFVAWKKIDPRASVVRLIIAWAGMLLSFLLVRMVVAWLMLGEWELTFTGPVYGTMVSDSSRIGDTVARLPDYLFQLRGHAGFVLLSYLVPVALLVVFALTGSPRSAVAEAADRHRMMALFIFAASVFVFVVGMTVKFSVDIVAADATQAMTRLQGRYYSFALPLLPICATIVLDRFRSRLLRDRPRLSGAILFVALVVVAWLVNAMVGPFLASFGVVDLPDTFFLSRFRYRVLALLVAVAMVVFLVWRWRNASLWFIGYWCLLMAVATIAAQDWAVNAIKESNEDRFPVAVRNLVGANERDSGLIVASTYADGKVFRVMFHLNSLSHAIILPPGTPLGEARIDGDRDWLLLLDNYRVVMPSQTLIKGEGFELVRLLRKP